MRIPGKTDANNIMTSLSEAPDQGLVHHEGDGDADTSGVRRHRHGG